jgi:hypothetical protein
LVIKALETHRDSGGVRASPALPEEVITEFGFMHTRHIKRLMEWGPAEQIIGNVVPSWDMHFAGKVLDVADLSPKASNRMLDWNNWHFTGLEIDTA